MKNKAWQPNRDRLARKVRITLLTVLILFCISGIFFFLLLKHGITVNEYRIGQVTITDFRLILKEKLELEMGSLLIESTPKEKTSTPNIPGIRNALDNARKYGRLFSLVSISNLSLGGRNVELNLHHLNDLIYELRLNSQYTDFKSRLNFQKNGFLADQIFIFNQRFNTRVSGSIALEEGVEYLAGSLDFLINSEFPLSLEFTADEKHFSFEGKEGGEIKEITSLVDLFGLDDNIQRWITQYLKGSRYHLEQVTGQFPWNDPAVILDTLQAKVRVDDTEYTFAPGLKPIKAQYTDVEFKQGVLTILPGSPTFYGQSGGQSWLDINFNDPSNIILTAYIKTQAQANDDILTLLEYYGIQLPCKQTGGMTDADLQLTINLNQIQVGAKGTFDISEGLLLFKDNEYRVQDARILLKDSEVTIDKLRLGYQELFSARVDGVIQAKKGEGELEIVLDEIAVEFKGSKFSLDESAAAPRARYVFNKERQIVEAGTSFWYLNSSKVSLGPFQGPISLDDLSFTFNGLRVDLSSKALFEIGGTLSVGSRRVDLDCKILEYNKRDLTLLTPITKLEIEFDEHWVFRTEQESRWSLNQIPVTLYPSHIILDDDVFKVKKSRISYGTFFDSQLTGYFNYQQDRGTFVLNKIELLDDKLEENLLVGEQTELKISIDDGHFVLNCPELGMEISSDEEKNWFASIDDLSSLYSRSKVLQKFQIYGGDFRITSENGKKPYHIMARLESPYSDLLSDSNKINNLVIDGKLSDTGFQATVNDKIQLEYSSNRLELVSENIGFNIQSLMKLSENIPNESERERDFNDSLIISLKAKDSYLYLSPQSRVMADSFTFNYSTGEVDFHLDHGPGFIDLKLAGQQFAVEGSRLNDVFMGALIQGSQFKGGQMSMTVGGLLNDFSALFEIKDTKLTNLVSLNNTMAFLNTVPALITFSLPEYSLTGLPLQKAVVGLRYKDKRVEFESMEFVSPSMKGTGKGWIDFTSKLMDIDMNITTESKKNISKIPIAGYILVGKKGDTSMTMKIKGDLDDPEVSHSLFKEIAAQPKNILLRTLRFPTHVLEELNRNAKKRQEEKGARDKQLESSLNEHGAAGEISAEAE